MISVNDVRDLRRTGGIWMVGEQLVASYHELQQASLSLRGASAVDLGRALLQIDDGGLACCLPRIAIRIRCTS